MGALTIAVGDDLGVLTVEVDDDLGALTAVAGLPPVFDCRCVFGQPAFDIAIGDVELAPCHLCLRISADLFLAVDDSAFSLFELADDPAVDLVSVGGSGACFCKGMVDYFVGGERFEVVGPDGLFFEEFDCS